MKKFMSLLFVLVAVSLPLWCSSSLSGTEAEELTAILTEVKSLNDEQQKIIENSEKRNEELESLSKEQEKTIEELESSSQTKQKIIDEQKRTIEELESLSKEQKKSAAGTLIKRVVEAVVSFCLGCLVGILFL